jgi:ABC-2 type transport system permease protein
MTARGATTLETPGVVSGGSRPARLMIRLMAAETSRLLSRRFTLIATIVVILALAGFQFAVNAELRPPTAAEQAAAQQSYEESHRSWQTNEQTCTDSGDPPDCRYPEPQLTDYNFVRPFDEVTRESLQVAIYLVALAGLMVAGSFIGAEYSTGSIANWLTFIPRRGQVFTAKLVIVAAFSALASAAAAGLMLGSAVLLARLYDIPVTKLASLVSMVGRGVLVGVALTVVGFCVGLVGRHTAAAIGVLLGYLFVWFVRNAILSDTEWAQRLTPWSPEGNLGAIVSRGYHYYVPVRSVGPDGVGVDYLERTVGFTHGLIYWAVVLAVIIIGSALIFRRRDVN